MSLNVSFTERYKNWEISAQNGDLYAFKHFYTWENQIYQLAMDDVKEAIHLWEKTKKKDQIMFCAVGQLYYFVSDFKNANQIWQRLLPNKSSRIYYYLAGLYRVAKHLFQDKIPIMIQYYKEAIEQGHIDAFVGLGICYETGWGVSQDETKACELYDKAISRGSRLGLLYKGDYFFEKNNDVEAMNYYRKTIKILQNEGGSPTLASMIAERLAFGYEKGLGKRKDPNEGRFYQRGIFCFHVVKNLKPKKCYL